MLQLFIFLKLKEKDMLTIEKIEQLLKVPVKCKEGRLMRLMSCENFIKKIFIFHSFDLPCNGNFDTQIKYSILKFSQIENSILLNSGNIDKNYISRFTNLPFLPTINIVKNAILEIKTWYDTLNYILETNDFSKIEFIVNNLSLENYIMLANFCGITDFSQNINCSRIIRRFSNFKELTKKFFNHNISKLIYLQETKNHKEYIESMYKIYQDFNLSEYDFMTFILLFDIRKNRNMLD